MTFHILAFGCQMNMNEAEWLERALLARGLRKAPPEEAQALIVITCSVRDKPEQKVYSLLGRWRKFVRRTPGAFVAVGGCVAQQIGNGFGARFDFVRLVFGGDSLAMAPQAIERLIHEPNMRISLLDFSEEPVERPLHLEQGEHAPDEGAPARFSGGRAFVNIMQGCDNFCAYCIVPYVRGRQKSRSPQAILDECRSLAERGVREVTLLGQNVNSYGLDSSAKRRGDATSFAALLRQVAAVDGIRRVRFTTSHPKDLSQEVIKAFADLENLCPQLHLPLQSGSDKILAAMGRKYDMERYLGIVRELRAARPEIKLSTDLLVGFPGESEEDFQKTLEAMHQVGYESSFSFIYSDRPGVRSEKMSPKVPREVAAERLEILQALQREFSEADLAAAVGDELEVLLEGPSKMPSGHPDWETPVESWKGRDTYNRVVNVTAPHGQELSLFKRLEPGMLITASITEAKKHSLYGKATGEPW